MRRPPIVCQRAAQSLQTIAPQHIWVPDEVLSLAVHRFFQSTCPQQKRYGSNVPGPLEARRRAAKRRMTASAGFYPQDSFPTSFNLGALFGYRSQPQTSWRYEPPSLPKDAPLLDTSSRGWVNDQSSEMRSQDWAIDVSSIDHDGHRPLTTRLTTPTGMHDEPVDLRDVAHISSDAQTIKNTSADTNNLDECLDKFKARLSPTKKGRFGAVVEDAFMKSMPAAHLVWKYYAAVLEHLHELGHDSKPVISSLLQGEGQLLRITNPVQAVDDCVEFMDQLDLVPRSPSVGRVFVVLALSAIATECSTTKSHDLLLLRLIQGIKSQNAVTRSQRPASHTMLMHDLASNLRSSAENALFSLHSAPNDRVIKAIHYTIRSVAGTPSGFVRAELGLFFVPRPQLLTLVPIITSKLAKPTKGQSNHVHRLQLLDLWLRLLHRVDAKVNNKKDLLKAAMVPLAGQLRTASWKAAIPSECFIKALLLHQDLDVQFPINTVGPHTHRPQNFFVDVLLQMQTQASSYTALLDLALPIVAEHAGMSTLLRFVRAMEDEQLPLSTRTDFHVILEDEIAALSSPTTNLSESKLQERAFSLQTCEKLANTLSRMGHALPASLEKIATLSGTRRFSNVLAYARANNALPVAYRDVTTDLSLMERVAVAHQLAYHFSRDTTRTQRQAWRFIYYLYKYLHSRSLPIGPLFTKAVVHASITRPLLENRFVSARRLIWVCHLVARVEGDEVAAQVENRFFAWRGDLIQRAKRVFVGVGGSKRSKAHVSSLKRLGLL